MSKGGQALEFSGVAADSVPCARGGACVGLVTRPTCAHGWAWLWVCTLLLLQPACFTFYLVFVEVAVLGVLP